jgi:hypothetical protein
VEGADFAADPLTRRLATEICMAVYGVPVCACGQRADMPACSTMVSAAKVAIRIVRAEYA